VLYTLGDGGEGLIGWLMGLVLIGGLDGAFVWMETLAESSGLSLGLDHGGSQMLGSDSRGLLDPKHRGKMQRWISVR
jgi:hypothetical protein